MRNALIAGNWKMNGTKAEAKALVSELRAIVTPKEGVDVVVCPPFTALMLVSDLLEGSSIALGAQDVFWKEKGAYTGQVSPMMLEELGCQYVIIGHSEPRGRFGVSDPDLDDEVINFFADTDASINRKLKATFSRNLTPILCVGETLAERQAEDTDAIITGQLFICLKDITAEQAAKMVIAYEPVWAIGTGEVCSDHEAERVCEMIRDTMKRMFNVETSESLRILYGGSVKPDNAEKLLNHKDIDGALVGGASLKAADFAKIVAFAEAYN